MDKLLQLSENPGIYQTPTMKRVMIFLITIGLIGCSCQRIIQNSSELVVHVVENDVELVIDNERIKVRNESPATVTFELKPGRHQLKMYKSGKLIFSENFLINRGQSLVTIAYDPERVGKTMPAHTEIIPQLDQKRDPINNRSFYYYLLLVNDTHLDNHLFRITHGTYVKPQK